MIKSRYYRLLMIIISILIVYIASETLGLFSSRSDKIIVIPEGATFSDITDILHENDIIANKKLFTLYAKVKSGNRLSQINTGSVAFKGITPYKEVLSLLIGGKRLSDNITITIPEGYNLKEIKNLLYEKGLIAPDTFDEAIKNHNFGYDFIPSEDSANKLEGYLFPDTYYFTKDDNEITIINAMLKRFDEIISKYDNDIKNSEYSLSEIITLASIIEKEGGNDDDFKIVSSVFHNRLGRNDHLSYLQSCATVQYLINEKKSVLSNSDIAIDSPYNTYKYPGLPIGPIASPGEAAIGAALNPANTDYLYFQNDKDGILHFTNNYNEHLENMRKYQ